MVSNSCCKCGYRSEQGAKFVYKNQGFICWDMSHAFHRVVYSKLPALETAMQQKFIFFYFKRFALLTILISFIIVLGKDLIFFVFNVDYVTERETFIYFPVAVGLLFPLTDYSRAILRYFSQAIVVRMEVIFMVLLVLIYLTLSVNIEYAMVAFLLISFLLGLSVLYYVRKAV